VAPGNDNRVCGVYSPEPRNFNISRLVYPQDFEYNTLEKTALDRRFTTKNLNKQSDAHNFVIFLLIPHTEIWL